MHQYIIDFIIKTTTTTMSTDKNEYVLDTKIDIKSQWKYHLVPSDVGMYVDLIEIVSAKGCTMILVSRTFVSKYRWSMFFFLFRESSMIDEKLMTKK